MTDLTKTIASLGERVAKLRSEFERTLEELSQRLDEAQRVAGRLETGDTGLSKRLQKLEERTAGQNELIETLTEEAREARSLGSEVRERELEIERLAAEISSKDELIRALRRQLAEARQRPDSTDASPQNLKSTA